MNPAATTHNIGNRVSLESVFIGKSIGVESLFAWNIFSPKLTNHVRCQVSLSVSLSGGVTFFHISVNSVILGCSFKEMARIEAAPIITTMEGAGTRHSSIKYKERSTRDYFLSAINSYGSIASAAMAKWPFHAGVGIAGFDSLNEVVVTGSLGRHRCSSKASVLGGSTLNSAPPF